MATRYYYFNGGSFDAVTIQNQIATPMVVIGTTLDSLLVVEMDDTPPNDADLIESMAAAGYTLAGSSLVAPSFDLVRDHGRSANPPTVPVPGDGDRFYNRALARPEAFDAARSLWDPVTGMYRPAQDDGTIPAALFVNNLTGNDNNDGLSALTPFATLRRAIQYLPTNPNIDRTITLATSGVAYLWPTLATSQVSRVTIQGDLTTVSAAEVITSIGASSVSNGLSITVAGAPWVIDQHRGRLVQFTSGPMNGQYGVVYSNTANTLNVTQDTRRGGFLLPAVGNTFSLLETGVSVSFPSFAPSFQSSIRLNFLGVHFTGTNRLLSVDNTDKVEFRRCRFDLQALTAGRGGSADLRTCYVRNVGSPVQQNGVLALNTDGVIELTDGTVVDAVAAGPNAHVSAQADSTYGFFGEVVMSALGANGVLLRQAVVYSRRFTQGTFSVLRFVNGCVGGFVVNPDSEGVGGDLDLPDLYGSVSATYGIRASGGAQIQPGSLSALTSAGGPNWWSADGGTSNVDYSGDGTKILQPGWTFQQFAPPEVIEIGFHFNTPSPVVISPLRPNDRVMLGEIEILSAFDDPGAQIQLGSVSALGGILTAEEIDPTMRGIYRTLDVYSVLASENLQVHLTPLGSTVGEGRARVQIWRADV